MNSDVERQNAVRIGLRVISSRGWQGGVNYIVNWVRATARQSLESRPEVWLLPYDPRGAEIANDLAGLVRGVMPFSEAAQLDLDMVFPATQIFEAPFGSPWGGWVPDWQCRYLPEMFDPTERQRRAIQYGLLARQAPLLVLSSRQATDDARRFFGPELTAHAQLPFPALFDSEDLNAARRDRDMVVARYDLPGRFFLVANQWWRHKNHALVIQALSRLPREICVVCTGATTDHRWPDYPGSLLASEMTQKLGSRLRVLGSVCRQDQLAMMLSAVSVVQPSQFEGWSTIVEEARALGVGLLLSRIPVHEEQAPHGARFFSVDDPDSLAEAMKAAWSCSSSPDLDSSFDSYVRLCVERLSDVAKQTRQRYTPERHDPALLMAQLLADINDDETEPALIAKFYSATRNRLAEDQRAFGRFVRHIRMFSASRQETILSRLAMQGGGEVGAKLGKHGWFRKLLRRRLST